MKTLSCLGWLMLPVCAQLAAKNENPNIVFILADDLSYCDIGVYGQEKIQTPHLDQLAIRGVRFTNAYAGSPVSAPSRCTLMTGFHTGHSRVRDNVSARGEQDGLAEEDVTIAQLLQKAGYKTGLIGKWGIGLPGSSGSPEKKGFDCAYGYYDQLLAHNYYPPFLYENGKKVLLPGNNGFDLIKQYRQNTVKPANDVFNVYDSDGHVIVPGVKSQKKAVYAVSRLEEKALAFIDENKDNPFFLYYATPLPHGPMIIDELGIYKDSVNFPDTRYREWAAMVTRIDNITGKIINKLKALNIYDNTIFIFASDNGYSQGGYFGRGFGKNITDDVFFKNKGPFRGGKFCALEGGLRVPFFVTCESRFPARVSGDIVWLIDLFPTLQELVGIKEIKKNDGESIVGILKNTTTVNPERTLYWEYKTEQMVRMGQFSAYRKSVKNDVELFLTAEDNGWNRNLSKYYPKLVAQALKIMQQEHVDSKYYRNPNESNAQYNSKFIHYKQTGDTVSSEVKYFFDYMKKAKTLNATNN